MGKAEIEIQGILSHLTCMYWHHTDTHTGITYRPHGAQSLDLERNVHRLLVLRGTINIGDKVPEDPWELFLSGYAPANTRRPAGEKMPPPPSCQSFPRSILLAPSEGNRGNQQQQSVTVRDGQLPDGHFDGEQQQQQQQEQDRESRRHIRFGESPTTGRMRAPRRLPPSPAPRARSFFD